MNKEIREFLLNRIKDLDKIIEQSQAAISQATFSHHASIGAKQEILNLLKDVALKFASGAISEEIEKTLNEPSSEPSLDAS